MYSPYQICRVKIFYSALLYVLLRIHSKVIGIYGRYLIMTIKRRTHPLSAGKVMFQVGKIW